MSAWRVAVYFGSQCWVLLLLLLVVVARRPASILHTTLSYSRYFFVDDCFFSPLSRCSRSSAFELCVCVFFRARRCDVPAGSVDGLSAEIAAAAEAAPLSTAKRIFVVEHLPFLVGLRWTPSRVSAACVLCFFSTSACV